MNAVYKALECSSTPLDYATLSEYTGLDLGAVKEEVKALWDLKLIRLQVTVTGKPEGNPIHVTLA